VCSNGNGPCHAIFTALCRRPPWPVVRNRTFVTFRPLSDSTLPVIARRGGVTRAARVLQSEEASTSSLSDLAHVRSLLMKPIWLALAILLSSNVAFATTRVCVSVQQKSWNRPASAQGPNGAPGPVTVGPAPPQASAPAPAPAVAADKSQWQPQQQPPLLLTKPPTGPHEIDPPLYLRRMLEYEVTHEVGFAAVNDRCDQRLNVELYPLETGWTAFARYSGTEREEKVAHAELDEFVELAQRLAFALLRNRSVGQTITRENVLRSDSETDLRTIEGTGHLIFGMGTEIRLARLPTAQGSSLPAANEVRVLTPVSIQIGYRRKLRAWGFDAFGRLNLGTENTGIHQNDLGGHVDYSTSVAVGLHFLHYMDAPGINSFYFGGGAAFELAFFDAIRPVANRTSTERDGLMGGGLNLDFLVGYEFLRASSVHFFAQGEVHVPTYLLKTENDSGAIDTYMPGALAQIGIIF
jgi:hypothetical protein